MAFYLPTFFYVNCWEIKNKNFCFVSIQKHLFFLLRWKIQGHITHASCLVGTNAVVLSQSDLQRRRLSQQGYTYSGVDLPEGWAGCVVMCSLLFLLPVATVLKKSMFSLEPVAGLWLSIPGVLWWAEGLKGRCDALQNRRARDHLSLALCCRLWTPWWLSPFPTYIMIASHLFLMLKGHLLCNDYSHYNYLGKQKQLHAWTI